MPMSKFLTLAALAIAVGGFAYYTLFWDRTPDLAPGATGDDTTEASDTATSDDTTDREPFSGVGTLLELQDEGEALECSITYTDADTDTRVTGTYFVAGEQLRGDFLTDSPDLSGQILTSMTIDATTMYTWTETDGEQFGMRVDLPPDSEDFGEIDANEPVPLDQQVQYTCTPWANVDNTIFQPPSDVLFQDMSELMQSGMEYGTLYDEEGDLPLDSESSEQ